MIFSPQTFPFFGVVPAILNESGEELEGPSEGYLVRIGGIFFFSFILFPPSPFADRPSLLCRHAGVQAAVAGCDEDRLWEPREIRNHLL